MVQYRDSIDPKVAKAGIQVRTGRKWRAEEADARGRCKAASQEPGGSGHMRQSGARVLSEYPNEHQGEGRRLVQEEVRAAVEEMRTCKAVGMTRWENTVERKVS